MTPWTPTLQTLFERSIAAARAAGACIMSYYGKELEVLSKGLDSHTGDAVTLADKEAEGIIYQALFPGGDSDPARREVAVLAEEMPDYSVSLRFQRRHTFLIDPLDGTRGFIDCNNSFGVSIGLIEKDGSPVFGVVLLPALGKLYEGVAGSHARENGKPLSPPPLDGELVLWVSEAEIFPAGKNRIWHHIGAAIQSEFPAVRKVRPACLASPVHKGCHIASATGPALYLGLPRAQKGVSLWDMAATAAIVSGAGGWVSDIEGAPLELNRAESTFVHHRGFVYCTHEAIARAAMRAYAEAAASL